MRQAGRGDEPFAVILSDDVIRSEEPAIGQLARVFDAHGGGVVAGLRVERSELSKYGVIDPSGEPSPMPGVTPLRGMVEKPEPEDAPSDVAIIGRYVLPPEIFPILERMKLDAKGEIQLTDGLRDCWSIPGSTPMNLRESAMMRAISWAIWRRRLSSHSSARTSDPHFGII